MLARRNAEQLAHVVCRGARRRCRRSRAESAAPPSAPHGRRPSSHRNRTAPAPWPSAPRSAPWRCRWSPSASASRSRRSSRGGPAPRTPTWRPDSGGRCRCRRRHSPGPPWRGAGRRARAPRSRRCPVARTCRSRPRRPGSRPRADVAVLGRAAGHRDLAEALAACRLRGRLGHLGVRQGRLRQVLASGLGMRHSRRRQTQGGGHHQGCGFHVSGPSPSLPFREACS